MAVYGYTRVSTQRQVEDGLSLDVQKRQIEGYALMLGLTVDAVLVEEGVSGSKPIDQRPEGGALFARLQAGDIVIAAKLDRCFRSALDALQTVDRLKKLGVKLHLIDLGGDIAANGLSKMFLTIAAAFAEMERDRTIERIVNTKADQKQQGRFLGGARPPFGYAVMDGKLVPRPGEQEAIAVMKRMKAEGKSLRAIAAAVQAMGMPLSHVSVGRVLRDNADA